MLTKVDRHRAHEAQVAANIPLAPQPPLRLLAENLKTGWSVNFPILGTCEPSAVCRRICYAAGGHFRFTNVQRANLARLEFFRTMPTSEVADRIYYEAKAHGLSHLRWCGSGDLFLEAVAVLNDLAGRRRDLVNVVYSRKPECINALAVAPQIVINVSLDRSSLDLVDRITHPEVRYTYLRETVDDVPPAYADVPIEVVFNNHGQHFPDHDARECAATNGRMPTAGACLRCRRCFVPVTTTRPLYRRLPVLTRS